MSILLEASSAVTSQIISPGDYVKFLTEELARHRAFLDDAITKLGAFLALVLAGIGGTATFMGWKSFKDIKESTREIFEREAKAIFNAKVAELNSKIEDLGHVHAAASKNIEDLQAQYKAKIDGIEEWLIKIQDTGISQQPPPPASAGAQAGPPTAGAASQAAPPPARAAAFKILWVDDSPSNNATLIQSFQKRGIEVETVLDTTAALDRLGSNRYNLVISDMTRAAGRMEGLVLLERLKTMSPPVDAVIYAGRAAVARYAERAAELGAVLVTANPGEVYEFVTTRFKNT